MSFTMIVKNEAIHIERIPSELLSELSALFYNSANIEKEIKISTENAAIARFIYKEIKQIFDISAKITVRKGYNFNKRYIYLLEITKKKEKILENLGLVEKGEKKQIPPQYIIDDEDLARAYLRGVFLACGSINDPKTSRYHMELLISKPEEAVFVQKLLNIFDLNAKILTRDKGYMIYMKEAEKIIDYLKLLGASNAVMYFENIRIYRDKKNQTNRLNNCEQANINKVVDAASSQLKQIEILKEHMAIELLDDKTKEALEYRLKYPEASLKELSEIISLETGKKITKSGLNHRFRKIKELVEKF